MDILYTVNPDDQYNIVEIIENYESYVWTERFIEAGDLTLVIPATQENVEKIKPGTIIGMDSSKELIHIDTRLIENGKITLTGKTLEVSMFGERYVGELGTTGTVEPETKPAKPIWLLGNPYGAVYRILDFMFNRILGTTGYVGTSESFSWPNFVNRAWVNFHPDFGPPFHEDVVESIEWQNAYEAILRIAKQYNVGHGVYREPNATGGYDIVFRQHLGVDKTTEILFSPHLDNLANAKEMLSYVDHENIVIVHPPNTTKVVNYTDVVRVRTISTDPAARNGFGRRIFEVSCNDFKDTDIVHNPADPTDKKRQLQNMMRGRGVQHLRAHKKTKIVDGEYTNESQYKYIRDDNPNNLPTYDLGDEISISGEFTSATVGVVTEYIRSVDAQGYRSYPTVVAKAEPEIV